jgi:anti-sigma factor RsiW
MNCRHVQELLPLYVGRDLEEKRAQQVTAHVQSCAECASCADEYRETRQLLQQFAPPSFSDAMYGGIRQRVLREIERESTAPTLAQLFASLVRPRLRWAVATALLLAVSMLAFYFIANQKNDRQQNKQQMVKNRGTGSQSDYLAGAVRAGLTGTAGAPPPLATSSPKPRLNLPAQRVGHSRRAGGAPAVPAESPSYSPVETKGPSLNPSATSEKTLRVEMQTKDRNIRIIWFSHQRIKQESPSKPSEST